ncbi:MAG: hypothetical protein IJN16_10415 [Lachnospiraceae bacterium]|nr:hypothetical protein [Lachnospiraceae bacterium]
MNEAKKMMQCKSCGAHFDEMLPKCPYCGSMSIKGAEAEYMDKLEDIREDMEDLSAVPIQETKKELKKQTKFVFIIVGVILGLALLLVLVELIFGYRSDKRDRQADYLWQQENFPILDELYEQKNYEELLKRYREAYKEELPIYSWEHSDFLSALELLIDFEDTLKREQTGEELTHWDYEDLLYTGFRVDDYETSTAYTAEEKELLVPYIEMVRKDFESRWQFTEKERKMFEKEAEKNYGYISYDVVEKYVKDWMERNGK